VVHISTEIRAQAIKEDGGAGMEADALMTDVLDLDRRCHEAAGLELRRRAVGDLCQDASRPVGQRPGMKKSWAFIDKYMRAPHLRHQSGSGYTRRRPW